MPMPPWPSSRTLIAAKSHERLAKRAQALRDVQTTFVALHGQKRSALTTARLAVHAQGIGPLAREPSREEVLDVWCRKLLSMSHPMTQIGGRGASEQATKRARPRLMRALADQQC